VHSWSKYGDPDLGTHIVERFSEDAHRVARGGGGCVLKGDGQDHALAGKDGLAVALLPSIQEPLDPKETTRLS
jgi:hypothetical protein